MSPREFMGETGFVDGRYTVKIQGHKRTISGRIRPPGGTIDESVHSIPDFGVLEMSMPPWFPIDGSAWDEVVDFINRLGAELEYFRLTMPRQHVDEDKLHEIEDIDAGDIITIEFINSDNNAVKNKVLITGCMYHKQFNKAQMKTIYGITLKQGNVTAARWSAGDTWGPGQEIDRWG